MRHWGHLASLRTRLLLLIFLAFVPVLALILYTASEERHLATEAVQNNAFQLLRPISVEYERLIDGAHQLLLVLTHLPAVRAQEATAANVLFAELLAENPAYANIGAIDARGILFASGLPFTGRVNLADRQYFRRAIQTRQFAIGDYQIGRVTRKATVNVGYPVVDDAGRVRVVVFAAIDLDWLNQLAARAQLPQGSIFTVIDATGMILVRYPAQTDAVGTSMADTALGRTILAQGTGVTEATGGDGIRRLVAFIPLSVATSTPGAYLSLGVPTSVAYAQANALLTRNLLLLGLVGVLTLVAAWVGSDWFVMRQINALAQAARRLGGGELTARTGLRPGPDELGQLTKTFDDMADAVEELTHENQSILNSAGEGIVGVDLDDRVTFINPAGLELLGWTWEELHGQPLHALTHHTRPDGTPYPWEACPTAATMREGTIHRVAEEILWRKDGMSFLVEFVCAPIWERGEIVGAVVVFQDITERRQMEERQQQFFRKTIEAATEGKLLICARDEITRLAGTPLASWAITRAEELATVRQAMTERLASTGMEEDRVFDFVVCLSEAATNAYKHAGSGRVSLHRRDDVFLVVVADHGPGIPAINLPELALKRGYTTAISLGMGYKAMISTADHVYLATGPDGTTVGIEMAVRAPAPPPVFTGLPQTW